jgi:protease-4
MTHQNTQDKPQNNTSGCFKWTLGLFICVIVLFVTFSVVIITITKGLSDDKNTFSIFTSTSEKYEDDFISGNKNSKNKIIVIKINGVISTAESSWGSAIANSTSIVNQLKTAAEDNNVKAIILQLNTPGGEVTAADDIYHQIIKLKNETGKPVISSMGALAASGGVYIAVASDYIIANKLTTTGSIGVIVQTYNYSELLKKIGVNAETYTSGKMKDLLNGARPRTEEEKTIIKDIINEVYLDFAKHVAEGRPKISLNTVLNTNLGDGRIFSGKQAYEKGLVDQLGYFEDAVAKAKKMASIPDNDYQVISYKKEISFADFFASLVVSEKKLNVNIGPSSRLNTQIPQSGKFYLLPTIW